MVSVDESIQCFSAVVDDYEVDHVPIHHIRSCCHQVVVVTVRYLMALTAAVLEWVLNSISPCFCCVRCAGKDI